MVEVTETFHNQRSRLAMSEHQDSECASKQDTFLTNKVSCLPNVLSTFHIIDIHHEHKAAGSGHQVAPHKALTAPYI
jgi:hypothetical protein